MKRNPISILFTGNIGFDRYMDQAWNDEDLISSEIMDYFASADYRIIGMEGAIIREDKINMEKNFFLHYMNPEVVAFTRRIKSTHWNINNNHIMDVGDIGIESTLKIAKQEGVVTLGAELNLEKASEPVYIDECGGIGLISVGYRNGCIPAGETSPGCFPWDNYELIERRLKEIKSRCRWSILTVHGGEEFLNMPLPKVRERYLHYLDLGADIVVGCHPHVVQNYETVGNKMIFYSLGNFIFDTDYQRAQFNTNTGVILKLNFSEEESFTWDAIGVYLNRDTKRLTKVELPGIFSDVNSEQFDRLTPLNAAACLKAEKTKMICVHPDEFGNYTDEMWDKWFDAHEPDVRWYSDDIRYMKELASTLNQKSTEDALPAVRTYIEEQL